MANEDRNVKLKPIYMAVITLVGFFYLTLFLYPWPSFNYLDLIFLTLLNFCLSFFQVGLPSGMFINLSYPITIAIFLLLGPAASVISIIPGLTVGVLRRRRPERALFNIAQVTLSLKIATIVYTLLGGETGQIIDLARDWPQLVLTLLVLDIANKAFVSIVLFLEGRGSFKDVFISSFITDVLKILPLYYTAGIILTMVYQIEGIAGGILVSLPLLSAFFILRDQQIIKQSKEQAITDPLTGLYNRHFLNFWFNKYMDTFIEEERELVAFMIDIDDFKQVNDNYGHQAGDEILKQVATTICESLRVNDVVFRYGGEEFVVLLPRTGAREAVKIGERIRRRVSEISINGTNITVSIGLASLLEQAPEERSKEELLRQADNAAYLAKFKGKNQICTYT